MVRAAATPTRCVRTWAWGVAVLLSAGVMACGPSPEAVPVDADGHQVFFPAFREMVYLPPSRRASGLLIDRFEVTDGEFEAFIEETGWTPDGTHALRHWDRDGASLRPPTRNTPVRWVRARDAEAYAAWAGKVIPTAEEWLRASELMRKGYVPWPNAGRLDECANTHEFGWGRPCPVGVFAAGRSETNCYDLLGNVSEWTSTPVWSGDRRRVMGGSFNTVVDAAPPSRLSRNRRALSSRTAGAEEYDLPVFSLRGGEWRVADERAWDIGFRCVIRDADPHIERAVADVAQWTGAERLQAIHELLSLGAVRSGGNRILPFVEERLTASRAAWSLDVDEAPRLWCSPVPLDDDAVDDLVVLSGDRLEGRSGRNGALIAACDLPPSWSNETQPLAARDGDAWYFSEGRDGGLTWVQLPTFETLSFPPLPDDVSSRAFSFQQFADGTLVGVQDLERSERVDGVDRAVAAVRLLVARQGDVKTVTLPGAARGVFERADGTLVIALEESFDIDVEFPFTAARSLLETVGALAVAVVDLETLAVRVQRRVVPRLEVAEGTLVQSRPMGARSSPWPEFFLTPPPPDAEGTLVVAVASEVLSIDGAGADVLEVAHEFQALSLPDLTPLDRFVWRGSPRAAVQPADRPATWLALDDQQASEIRWEGGRFEVRAVAQAVPGGDRPEWWASVGDVEASPFLDLGDPDGLTLVRAPVGSATALRIPDPAARRAKGRRRVPGHDAWALLTVQPSRAMLIDFERGGLVWDRDLGPTAGGDLLSVAAGATEADAGYLLGRSESRVWRRGLDNGREVDHLEVHGTRITGSVLGRFADGADLTWALVLRSRETEPEQSRQHRIVAYRSADPSSSEARLLDDFRRVARDRVLQGLERER